MDEIRGHAVGVGEDDDIERERTMLANAEKLSRGRRHRLPGPYGGGEDVPAATDRLGEALEAATDLARIDPSQEDRPRPSAPPFTRSRISPAPCKPS